MCMLGCRDVRALQYPGIARCGLRGAMMINGGVMMAGLWREELAEHWIHNRFAPGNCEIIFLCESSLTLSRK